MTFNFTIFTNKSKNEFYLSLKNYHLLSKLPIILFHTQVNSFIMNLFGKQNNILNLDYSKVIQFFYFIGSKNKIYEGFLENTNYEILNLKKDFFEMIF